MGKGQAGTDAVHSAIQELVATIALLDQALGLWLSQVSFGLADAALHTGDLALWQPIWAKLQTTNTDLVVRHLSIPGTGSLERGLLLVYLAGLVDEIRVADAVPRIVGDLPSTGPLRVEWWGTAPVQRVRSWPALVKGYLAGQVVVVCEGYPGAVLVDVAQPPHRSVGRTETEQSIRGPRKDLRRSWKSKLANSAIGSPPPTLCPSPLRSDHDYRTSFALSTSEGWRPRAWWRKSNSVWVRPFSTP